MKFDSRRRAGDSRDFGRGREGAIRPRSSTRGPSTSEAARLLPDNWEHHRYLALDVETTGLDARTCRIVEIGALLFSPAEGSFDGTRLDRLVDPGMPIPPRVTAIHGITDADVRGAPSFADIAHELTSLAKGAIIVAHNAPFDIGFVRSELARAGLPSLGGPILDSLVLARAAFPGRASYSLPRLAAAFRISTARSHRALDDAIVAAKIFVEAGKRLRSGGPGTENEQE